MGNTTSLTNLTTPEFDFSNYFDDDDYSDTDWDYSDTDWDSEWHQLNLLEQRMNIFSIVVYSLIFVLGTIGNGLVIFITGFRMKKTVNTVWILNLAIADFTSCFFLPWVTVKNNLEFHQTFDQIMCELKHTLVYYNLFASVYTLMVISVDRFIAVWCSVWARNHRTPRLASFVVLGVWILALVLCSLKLCFTKSFFLFANKIHCVLHDGFHLPREGYSIYIWVSIRFVFGFIIPFIVIVVCYGAVVWRLRRDQLSHSRKPFKVITAVIVAFFVCWFPLHFFSMYHVLAHSIGYTTDLDIHWTLMIGLPMASSLAYFNSCLNPILYFCLGYNFKEKLRCSLFFDLLSAFTEESDHSNPKTSSRPSTEMESQVL